VVAEAENQAQAARAERVVLAEDLAPAVQQALAAQAAQELLTALITEPVAEAEAVVEQVKVFLQAAPVALDLWEEVVAEAARHSILQAVRAALEEQD